MALTRVQESMHPWLTDFASDFLTVKLQRYSPFATNDRGMSCSNSWAMKPIGLLAMSLPWGAYPGIHSKLRTLRAAGA